MAQSGRIQESSENKVLEICARFNKRASLPLPVPNQVKVEISADVPQEQKYKMYKQLKPLLYP